MGTGNEVVTRTSRVGTGCPPYMLAVIRHVFYAVQGSNRVIRRVGTLLCPRGWREGDARGSFYPRQICIQKATFFHYDERLSCMLFFPGAECAGLIEKTSVSDSDARYQFWLVIFYVFILIFVIAMLKSLWQTEPVKVLYSINYQ